MSKIDTKKWTKGNVLYSPFEDEIGEVMLGLETGTDNLVVLLDSEGLRCLEIYPTNTANVVEWVYLGDVNAKA